MNRSTVITVGLAAIVCCHFHCVVHGASGARHLGEALTASERGQPLPINGETPRTEDESGCICHGAVLTAATVAPAIDLECCVDLQPPGWPAWNRMATVTATFVQLHPPDAPALITGRILRAWIASLVI